jgi:hypothetical protein
MGGGASNVEDRRQEDAAPHVWMSQLRTTDMGSESKVKVNVDSPLMRMEEGQEWDKDG